MNEDTFNIVFPIGILILYFAIKLSVDNKNNRTPWYEDILTYPLDILFLGFAFIGGTITKNLSISLLSINILIVYFAFCFILKHLINLSINLYYSDRRKIWSWLSWFFNIASSIILIIITLHILDSN